MRPQPLNAARIGVVVVFALSCFGILVYLWDVFGGPVPLKPKGYQVTVGLPESDLLTSQADVRISGVSVGKVVRTARRPNAETPNAKDAVLQIQSAYAPLPADVRATIRRKSIGGEMYLELTPGSSERKLADGGRIPAANVAPSVELDEVFRAFDPKTKRGLETWLQQQALSIDGRGRDLSDAFGNAAAFEEDATTLLRLLNEQQGAVRQAVANTGVVFDALAQSRGALQGLIVNGRRATDAFAQQDQAFADTWRALPAFERESRALLARADRFADNADPVVRAFRPAWQELGRTAPAIGPAATELKGLMAALRPLTDAGVRGLPATQTFITELAPLVREFSPFLAQLEPIVQHFYDYIDAVNAFWANTTAISNHQAGSMGSDRLVHYAKTLVTLNPASLARYQHRLPTNRSNPYALPNAIVGRDPLPVFDTTGCGPTVFPKLSGPDPAAGIPESLLEKIRTAALNDDQPTAVPCLLQRRPGGGGQYLHLQPLSPNRGGARTP